MIKIIGWTILLIIVIIAEARLRKSNYRQSIREITYKCSEDIDQIISKVKANGGTFRNGIAKKR